METLNIVLKRELALLLRTWNYHWNVEGPLFPSLHKLFEAQYDELQELVDEVAERIRSLGGVAPMQVSLDLTNAESTSHMLDALADAHESLSAQMRTEWVPALSAAGDAGTADLLTRALQLHDKAAWMLRATAK
ncbi:MAG: DNA starvation/stationary phase protection protein [Paludibaculum sp.]